MVLNIIPLPKLKVYKKFSVFFFDKKLLSRLPKIKISAFCWYFKVRIASSGLYHEVLLQKFLYVLLRQTACNTEQ